MELVKEKKKYPELIFLFFTLTFVVTKQFWLIFNETHHRYTGSTDLIEGHMAEQVDYVDESQDARSIL